MKTRKLGSTPLNLSTIGLGSWPFSNTDQFGWGPQSDKDTIGTVHRAMELGVNWIDAAPIYGRGKSEEAVGRALKGLSKKPIIATKALFMWKPDGTPFVEEGWETLAELKKEGKVGQIGVSNFSVEQMEMIKPIHPVAFLEPPYSMLERGVEQGILDYCGKNNIGVITYSSLQQGLLTNTPPDINKLTPKDVRRTSPHFKEPEYSINLKLGPELTAIAKKSGHTAAQMAIAWNLRRPEVTSAITGPRVPSEIDDTSKAADWQLTKEDITAVEALLAKRLETLKALPK